VECSEHKQALFPHPARLWRREGSTLRAGGGGLARYPEVTHQTMRFCVSQIAELQNVRVLLEEARIQAGTHPEHRHRRLEASLRAALRELDAQSYATSRASSSKAGGVSRILPTASRGIEGA
jgi:hypothetical protein